MAVRPVRLLFLLLVALFATAPAAAAADGSLALPDQRTHVDGAGTDENEDEGPRLTLFESDTDAADIRRGYLYVKARCSRRCTVEVTARARVNGKRRVVAFKRQTLPSRRVRRIRMRIRSEVRGKVSPTARVSYRAVPYPPF